MGCKRKPFIPEPAEGAETPLKLTLLGEKSSASQSSPSSTALGQATGRVLPVHACAHAWAHHLHNCVCHHDKSRLARAPAAFPVSLEVAWLLEVGFAGDGMGVNAGHPGIGVFVALGIFGVLGVKAGREEGRDEFKESHAGLGSPCSRQRSSRSKRHVHSSSPTCCGYISKGMLRKGSWQPLCLFHSHSDNRKAAQKDRRGEEASFFRGSLLRITPCTHIQCHTSQVPTHKCGIGPKFGQGA